MIGIILWIRGREPVLSFAPREWVLIADFENQTGEALFDQSLNTALAVSMQQSQYANVLSRSRVTAALRRMNKPAGQKIDEPVGTEICQREKVRGLIVPGISKVGQKYTLAARIVDPYTGDTVRSYLEPAADQDRILGALDALAVDIRRDLGESLSAVRQSSRELRQVTTPSLEALKLFSDGVTRWSAGDYKTSVQLHEQALKLDPDFAKAHAALGISYCSFIFNDRVKGKAHLDTALKLSDRVTERERQQIQIQHENNVGTKQNALNLFRVYLQAYPDDTMYRFNYAAALREERQTEAAIAQYIEVLRVDPGSASSYINLAGCYRALGKYPEALGNYTKAFALEPAWMTSGNLNHEYGCMLVLLGRFDEARDVYTKAFATSKPGALRSLAMLELYQGRYANARKHLEEALLLNVAAKAALNEARNHLYLSLVFEGTRNVAGLLAELDKAVANLKGVPPQVWLTSRLGVGYARAGEVRKARALLDVIRTQAETQIAQQSADVHRLEGELQLAQGDRAAAIDTLLLADREAQTPLTTESLARAYRISGDAAAAMAQYERLVAGDEGTVGWEPQQEWLASHYHLASLYQGQGQKEKAAALAGKLLQLWKDADPDLPLLKDVRRLNTGLGG